MASFRFLEPHAKAFTSSVKLQTGDEDAKKDSGIRQQAPLWPSAPLAYPSHISQLPYTPDFGHCAAATHTTAVATDAVADSPASPPPSPADSLVGETRGASSAMRIPTLGLIRPSPPPDSDEPPSTALSVPSSPEHVERIMRPNYDKSRLYPPKEKKRGRSRRFGRRR